jgi:Asp-tRNA(Asn)/Glu-tRNA(Gln) amidotransferase A subunit family amidase
MNGATRREAIGGGLALAAVAGLSQRAEAMTEVFDTTDSLGLAALVKARKVSPAELLEGAIARAEQLNPRFNFLAQRHYDRARKAVAAGLPDGPFRGVPWLLKDLGAYMAGEVTESGSRLFRGYRSTVTSELVKRVERAGFVIFGKTTSPEFGLTGTTENKLTGDTRNPWNPAHITGGSSGGAAAAVSAGVVSTAHASDGGGSIRIPASCCGLFGLKPSRGRVPMGPPHTEGWGGLSVEHAITHSVRDSAAILDVIAGIEPGSRYGAPSPRESFLSQVTRSPGRLRIALMTRPLAGTPVDPQCVDAAHAAARLCESLGHHVTEAAPKIDAAELGFASFVITGASVAAEVEDRAKAAGLDPATLLEPITQGFVEYGKQFSARDYVRANNIFQAAALTMATFMQDYDVILTPTLAAPPLELGRINLTPDCDFKTWGDRTGAFAAFTPIANMTGQPAMSVPLAMSREGLPIGIQFIGRYGAEALLFRLAGQLERAAPWSRRQPQI